MARSRCAESVVEDIGARRTYFTDAAHCVQIALAARSCVSWRNVRDPAGEFATEVSQVRSPRVEYGFPRLAWWSRRTQRSFSRRVAWSRRIRPADDAALVVFDARNAIA
jgi:hypothetical protein